MTEDSSTEASGLMLFGDSDLADAHSVSVTPAGAGYLGTLTASVVADPSGATTGLVAWHFAVDPAALQFLAGGDELTQTYTLTIDDGAGGVVSEQVVITLIGTNDAPLVTDAVDNATITEGSLPVMTANGTIDFGDVDLADAHVTSVTPGDGGYLGTFVASVTDPSTGDGVGQVTWLFAANNALRHSLGAGQVLVQTYTVEIEDGHGGTATQVVTITINGTNDAPVAVADDNAGDAVVESGVNPGNTPFAATPRRPATC